MSEKRPRARIRLRAPHALSWSASHVIDPPRITLPVLGVSVTSAQSLHGFT